MAYDFLLALPTGDSLVDASCSVTVTNLLTDEDVTATTFSSGGIPVVAGTTV